MKASYLWLQELVGFDASHEEVEQMLIRGGIEVEGVEPVGDDWCYELEVTSNRADCLGMIGIARELAIQLEQPFALPDPQPASSGSPVSEWTSIQVDDAALCPLYTARGITGVTIGPSPAWLVQRLETIGIRSVNNIVDITNFVMMESGQPLHAFDAAKLEGRQIVVRPAADGESITAIDNREYKLSTANLAIADGSRPVAVAGVMGGADSEISDGTTDVLLESAVFNAISVRRTSRSLKLFSDSSYRFERGVTPEQVDYASRRAATMIAEIAGGTVLDGVLEVGETVSPARSTTLRLDFLERMLGMRLAPERVKQILSGIGFTITNETDGVLSVDIPAARQDVDREVDLIEEVARVNGFEAIPVDADIPVAVATPHPEYTAWITMRRAIAGLGYQEVMTWSFNDASLYSGFDLWDTEPLVPMLGADGEPEKYLRNSLLPGLLDVARVNEGYRVPVDRAFEISSVYRPAGDGFVEPRHLSMLRRGDVLDVKGDLAALLETVGNPPEWTWAPFEHSLFRDGAVIRDGDAVVGYAGTISPAIADRFDLNQSYAVLELKASAIQATIPDVVKFTSFPRYPAVDRDLAFIFDESVTWAGVEADVRSAGGDYLERIEFFDLYRGKGVEPGRKSLAFSLRFRSNERTLTAEDVDGAVAAICSNLEGNLGGQLRK
jgi:phenylalanyl-tRNA synthetase beta chain